MAQEESSWWVLYTWDNTGNPKTTRLPFILGILGVRHSGQMGISALMFSVCNSVHKWRKHCICSSIQMVAKDLYHILCPKLGSSFLEASHPTRLWPSIINLHPALLSQESDSRPSAFSEVLAMRLFVVHSVE